MVHRPVLHQDNLESFEKKIQIPGVFILNKTLGIGGEGLLEESVILQSSSSDSEV